jgi:hypothetical protein
MANVPSDEGSVSVRSGPLSGVEQAPGGGSGSWWSVLRFATGQWSARAESATASTVRHARGSGRLTVPPHDADVVAAGLK